MKATGALPTEDRVKRMNTYQWLWYYFNILEEQEAKFKLQYDQIDYLSWFINPDMAKVIKEKNNRNNSDEKYEERNVTRENEVINDTFEDEIDKILNNEKHVDLPDSHYKSTTESKDEFFKRAMAFEEFLNNQPNIQDDDLDIIYTPE